MARRFAEYKKINNTEKGDPVIADFFKENKNFGGTGKKTDAERNKISSVEIQKINIENDQNIIFDNIRTFIERVKTKKLFFLEITSKKIR